MKIYQTTDRVMDNILERLKEEVEGLQALLADPHPGLAAWGMAVAQRWRHIAELYQKEDAR